MAVTLKFIASKGLTKMDKNTFNILYGFYINNVVRHRHKNKLTEYDRKNIREKNKDYAITLDKLKISWKVQNKIAYEASKPRNWNNYHKDTLKNILTDSGMIL